MVEAEAEKKTGEPGESLINMSEKNLLWKLRVAKELTNKEELKENHTQHRKVRNRSHR